MNVKMSGFLSFLKFDHSATCRMTEDILNVTTYSIDFYLVRYVPRILNRASWTSWLGVVVHLHCSQMKIWFRKKVLFFTYYCLE